MVWTRWGYAMIRCVCIGCSTVVQANDDAAGTILICPKCGGVIQVPEAPPVGRAAPGPASVRPKAAAAPRADRRAQYILGGMYGLFVLCLPLDLIHSQDGSPICLAMFAVNLALGTGAGFLFFVGLHTPDYLTDWLHMNFTRLRTAAFLLPLTVLGFVVAVHIYSP